MTCYSTQYPFMSKLKSLTLYIFYSYMAKVLYADLIYSGRPGSTASVVTGAVIGAVVILIAIFAVILVLVVILGMKIIINASVYSASI